MTDVEPESQERNPVARATEYYARIGRVVASCALMELWVLYLVDTLDHVDQLQAHAGKHGTELTAVCRAELAKATGMPDETRDEVTALLEEVDSTLKKRNYVVHSVASWPGALDGYAHRPLPKKQRAADQRWIGDARLTADFLDQLYAQIQDRIERLISVHSRVERAL